jgi:adenosylcobinamide-phosphate synthase
LLVAALLDRRFGEPPDRWHPVAWLGRLLSPLGRALTGCPPALSLVAGVLSWLLVTGTVAVLAWWLQHLLLSLPVWAAVPLLALALKPSFAWRMLHDEVAAVETAFTHGLPAARQQLSRLCSRDVEQLGAVAVRETAIETLAENLNDSLVAPLFWFVVAGLPGAWAWRAVNTMDAMWGYRGRWEWAGKCAARADDVLAWLPARISAALLWRPGLSLRQLRHEAARTPSPNGGWPMAAMALRLGVSLSKPGVYRLNAAGDPADAEALHRALRIAPAAARACWLLALACLLAAWAWPALLRGGLA